MVFGKTPPPAGAPAEPAVENRAKGRRGLGRLIHQEIVLHPEKETQLKEALQEGLAFYRQYNESRLQLAFDAFDEDMRSALFELMFLLHVNDASLSEIPYTATRTDFSGGLPREVEEEATINLFVEDAPHGVRGLEGLSPILAGEFRALVRKVFGGRGVPAGGGPAETPIVCLQSIGSIGTIGHKSVASDLDLQVIFDLSPPGRSAEEWGDEEFLAALAEEHGWWVERLREEQGINPAEARKAEVLQGLAVGAHAQIQRTYPLLYGYLLTGEGNYEQELAHAAPPGLATRLVEELMTLAARKADLIKTAEQKRREALLRERVELIQTYISEKYPRAEIYMFACALESYRAGRYTSSLQFKESSGSAYELLLNWDTLMPGIHFTPPLPTHFLFPKWINDDTESYRRLLAHIRFQTLELYRELFPSLVDLGNTPALDGDYLAAHRAAVYWEAFKASSGNLPKATLNLLRYEMLLEPALRKTIIEIIKEPKFLNGFITPRSGDTRADRAALENDNTGVPNWALAEMEQEHPQLLFDPWWLRFKALKIAFGEAAGVTYLRPSERAQISKILDLAFALHVRISDVFTRPGDTRPFESHREKVLLSFLAYAFPGGGSKRENLEHLFQGEMKAVNRFESDLRFHFRWALERTQKAAGDFDLAGVRRTNPEVQLWFNYFEENFQPPQNVVQRTIMNNLKISRGRLVIGHRAGQGWSFQSNQKESTIGRRFDTFGILRHLPETVTLVEAQSFLFCLATCILNQYFGILHGGTLRETRTAVEYNLAQINVGTELDREAAAVRPDHLNRMLDRILAFFPSRHHNYLDHLRVKRKVERAFLFLNLWKFGRLSILYADNLGTWYCDDFDHPELVEAAGTLRKEPTRLLRADALHTTLSHFLWDHGVKLEQLQLAAWVNPGSVETTHDDPQSAVKEQHLSSEFLRAVREILPGKTL